MGDVPLILKVQTDMTLFLKNGDEPVRCRHMTAAWLTGLAGVTD